MSSTRLVTQETGVTRTSELTNSPTYCQFRDLRGSSATDWRRNADHASSTMHIASGTRVRPFDLTPKILKKRSRRSEDGQIVQELNSIREGKYWDDAKGGWLDPVLVQKARGGDEVREEARGV